MKLDHVLFDDNNLKVNPRINREISSLSSYYPPVKKLIMKFSEAMTEPSTLNKIILMCLKQAKKHRSLVPIEEDAVRLNAFIDCFLGQIETLPIFIERISEEDYRFLLTMPNCNGATEWVSIYSNEDLKEKKSKFAYFTGILIKGG